ncbi:MAG: phosphotransferase [Actinobacteria bacterium]|nr:phosphotransferase [Actinomycetota bacterium]
MSGGTVPGAAAVLDAVAAAVQGWYGPGAALEPGGVRRRAWSCHLTPTVTAAGRAVELIVKVPLWEGAPDLQAALAAGPQPGTRAEFETLQAIEAMVAAAGDPGLTVVHPVAYLPAVNAVVTERLPSVPLKAVRGGRARAAGLALGRWLRRFHDEIGGAAEAPFDPAVMDADLGDIAARGRRIGGAAAAAAAALGPAASALAGAPARRAVTHGDLGPSNILVTAGGAVAVIDPNLVEAPVGADAAKLAAALRTPRTRLMAGLPRGSGLHPVEAAVLEGYGRAPDAVYRFLRRVAVMRRWLEVEESASGVRAAALGGARRVFEAETA